jgi:hypothetical protein
VALDGERTGAREMVIEIVAELDVILACGRRGARVLTTGTISGSLPQPASPARSMAMKATQFSNIPGYVPGLFGRGRSMRISSLARG